MIGWIVVGVIAAILIIGALWAIGLYNSLVSKRVQCQNGWSQIDVQLKRRHDLIPNLVETVKGYAAHERGTLDEVIAARGRAVSAQGVADQAQAENMLTAALGKLFALSEAYPNLKANQNFSELQEELSSTENKIGFARQYYNDTVSQYNTAIQSFPANMFAASFGFAPREFFELDNAAEKEAPKVQF